MIKNKLYESLNSNQIAHVEALNEYIVGQFGVTTDLELVITEKVYLI